LHQRERNKSYFYSEWGFIRENEIIGLLG
jgi:hypothetical protein